MAGISGAAGALGRGDAQALQLAAAHLGSIDGMLANIM